MVSDGRGNETSPAPCLPAWYNISWVGFRVGPLPAAVLGAGIAKITACFAGASVQSDEWTETSTMASSSQITVNRFRR